MKILTLILLAAGLADAEIPLEEVSLDRPGLTLHATLYQPAGARDLVVIHAGSGPTDRHGNQPSMHNDSLKLLAEGLAERGVAVLAVDKRGVGQSVMPTDERALRPSVFIADLVAWAEWAGARNPDWPVHLLGHSEGALFAKAAAGRADAASVISLAGAGRPIGVVLREQTEGKRPGKIGEDFERILSSLEAGQQVAEIPPMFNALFRPSIQPYLIEWLAMDPAALAADLETPLLVIGGGTDIQAGRADFNALGHQATRAEWIDGMNHVLKAVEGDITAQLPSYTNPDLPLHPALVPLLAEWIERIGNPGRE
ncbi:MAG: alpha/beta fold hydrolase [Wenzhouxiangellaceae bacterium]|nr:alpha/beta fold hydrolase [Wenzhouxiangellaceae bacterium]